MITKEELSVIMESVTDLVEHRVAEVRKELDEEYLRREATLIENYKEENDAIREQLSNLVESIPDSLGALKDDTESLRKKLVDYRKEAVDDETNIRQDLMRHIESVRDLVGDTLVADRDQLEVSLRLDLEQAHEKIAELEKKIADADEKLYSEVDSKHEDLLEIVTSYKQSMELVLQSSGDQVETRILDKLKSHDLRIQKQRSDDQVRIMELLAEYRRLPDARKIVPWQSDRIYDIGSNVRYQSGVWSNLKSTDEVPGDGEDWVCVSTGIDRIEVLDKHPNGVRATVGIYDSLGKEHRVSFDLPTVNRLPGSWVEDAKYLQLDSVMHDGMRWIANKDHPKGKPGDGEDWIIESMRGPAGRRGQPGKLGPIGPVGPEGPSAESLSLDHVVGYLKSIDDGKPGIRLNRYCGNWSPGTAYEKGDIVDYRSHLRIATRDLEPSIVPGMTSENWLFLSNSE